MQSLRVSKDAGLYVYLACILHASGKLNPEAQVARRKNRFGTVQLLKSKKFRAFYTHKGVYVKAPRTFVNKSDANDWLLEEELLISKGLWVAPDCRAESYSSPVEFCAFLEHYKNVRRVNGQPIRDTTKALYDKLARNRLSQFAGRNLASITPTEISTWYANQSSEGRITSTSAAYRLIRGMFNQAMDEGADILSNPCNIKGVNKAKTGKLMTTPNLEQVKLIANAIEPEYRLMVLISAYGVLRFGELAGLQAKDFRRTSFEDGTEYYDIRISKQASLRGGQVTISPPKSAAGDRTTPVSPSLTKLIDEHLLSLAGNRTDWAFPSPGSNDCLKYHLLENRFAKALKALGFDGQGITLHSLRKSGATAYANGGANVAEVQSLLGDSSANAALLYIRETGRKSKLAASLPGI
jgi:integrase